MSAKLHAVCQRIKGESMVSLYNAAGDLWQATRPDPDREWTVRRHGAPTGVTIGSEHEMPDVLGVLGKWAGVDLR